MGSGASRHNRSSGSADKKQPRSPSGKKRRAKAAAAAAELALAHRRRVIFGTLAEKEHVAFESVAPRRQFSPLSILQSNQPEVGEDAVHERLDEAETQEFRRIAAERQDLDGYLDIDAIELLGLGLNTKGPLSKRLFHVAHLMSKREKELLTYYELLALHSVLYGGSRDELQRLLFFVFDVDEDDVVSVDDFAAAICAFLELQEQQDQMGIGLQGLELEEFTHLDEEARLRLATLLAEDVVESYGSSNKKKVLDSSSPKKGDRSASRGRCMCRGRAPADDGSKGESASSKSPSRSPPPAKKTRSWSLCRGKQPDDDGIRHSPAKPLLDEGAKKSSWGRQKRTTSSLSSQTKSRRATCGMCGRPRSHRSKKDLTPLTFEQWRHWFNDATGAKPHGGDEMPITVSQPGVGLSSYGRSDPFIRRPNSSYADPESSGSDR
eukprot:CAMPEP_0178408470 /NCGR_PEP_ID=MMETSP0689_2-20121128/19959_1 /TAXON_ID=160604 /ORGANISM="Amphidinium massartii, Strain CS-259" /LENGTH=435 /DNA_ID=CAMNT_0020029573 /DNA_START=139 /DNA_END=1446 /DNA_ORIENTATION=+